MVGSFDIYGSRRRVLATYTVAGVGSLNIYGSRKLVLSIYEG